MVGLVQAIKQWATQIGDVWNHFWFTPTQPHTLAAIRICGGAMIFYTHLVWTIDLMGFVGPNGFLPAELSHRLHGDSFVWSHLYWLTSPTLLWIAHFLALLVFALFTLGVKTRITSILSCLLVLSYCHRLEGALFGLDQVNAMLAMYLMIGACGDAYGLDAWRRRRQGRAGEPTSKVSTNIAIRLIQLHLCVIYLFGGIGKMRGELWWNGYAMWFAGANAEYQSLDLTWIIHYPVLMAFLTHATVFWETFYCFLVWPRLTRPIAISAAVGMHLGIALFMGMITFGVAMIIANLAFISPWLIRTVLARLRLGTPPPAEAKLAAA